MDWFRALLMIHYRRFDLVWSILRPIKTQYVSDLFTFNLYSLKGKYQVKTMEEKLQKCEKVLHVLCYVCGKYTPNREYKKCKYQCTITETVETNYVEVYGKQILNATYCPKIICRPCYDKLKNKKALDIVMEWNAPEYDHGNCYSCAMVDLYGFRVDNRDTIPYPNFPGINVRWINPQEESSQHSTPPPLSARPCHQFSPQPGTSSEAPTYEASPHRQQPLQPQEVTPVSV